jgi:hypothetical protein
MRNYRKMTPNDYRGILSSFWAGIVAAVGSSPAYFTAEPLFRTGPKATMPEILFHDTSSSHKPSGGGRGSRRHRQWKKRRAAGWDRSGA